GRSRCRGGRSCACIARRPRALGHRYQTPDVPAWIRALAWLARMGDELPELIVEDAAAWGTWLARRHATSDGVWLALAKRGGHPPTRLRYQEALEEALCYGWIDGQVRRRDADSYRQRFTPRRKRSAWSKRNVALAERLIGEGRMKPTGRAAIDQ